MTTGNQLTVSGAAEVVTAQPAPIRLSEQAIAIIQENIVLAEKLVTSVLERGVDWGSVQGIKGDFLFDTGASKIMAAFNCYSSQRVMYREETDDAISWAVAIDLISRDSHQVVGTGMGHASTREGKWGKKWSDHPERAGYTKEEAAQLDQRQFEGKAIEYRIANPNLGDLGHTLLAMACKRGEVDAVKSLPGVNSSLRKLFDPKLKNTMETDSGPSDIPLSKFWSMAKGVGLNEADVHRLLGVASVKTWVESGKTLTDAVILLWGAARNEKLAAAAAKKPKKTPDAGGEDLKPQDITQEQVKTVDALLTLCNTYWGMTEQQVFKELGYASRVNFVDAKVESIWNAWLTILAVKQPAL